MKSTESIQETESRTRKKIHEAWGYIVEILATTLSVIAACLWFGGPKLESFFHSSVGDFASYFAAAVFTGGFGMLGVLFSKTETPFGRWLHDRGAFKVFSSAYFAVVLVGIVSVLGLIFCKNTIFVHSGIFGVWFIVYTVINGYTLGRNSYDLIILNMAFNKKMSAQ